MSKTIAEAQVYLSPFADDVMIMCKSLDNVIGFEKANADELSFYDLGKSRISSDAKLFVIVQDKSCGRVVGSRLMHIFRSLVWM